MIPADDNGRVCDICGRLRLDSQCRKVDGYWVCNFHPEYVSRKRAEVDALPIRIRSDLQIPDARPLIVRESLESVEAELLKFVVNTAPIDLCDWRSAGVGGDESVEAAAWGALYLVGLIQEAKRPYRWIATARAKLVTLADWLVTNQAGSTNADLIWGGFLRGDGYYYTEDAGAAGLALLGAYEIVGDNNYLVAATKCAWFLRTCQCGDKLTTRPSSTDAAGSNAKHWGAWTHRLLTTNSPPMDHMYYPGDMIGLEFLYDLYTSQGDITIGSTATGGGTGFSTSRAALISVAIDEAVEYWSTTATGFTTSTPFERFNSYPATKDSWTGTGAWEYSDGAGQITSRNWALGLRAIAHVSGTSAALARFNWLAAFTSNSSLELDSPSDNRMLVGWSPTIRAKCTKGNYLASSCPAVTLQVLDSGSAVSYNADSIYDLAAWGHLASLYTLQHRSDFEDTRETMGRPQPKFRNGQGHDNEYLRPLLLGRCGLSLQPWSNAGATERYGSVARAAQAGRVFRTPPFRSQLRGIQ